MRSPKVPRKEAPFLDDKQTAKVLSLLNDAPIKWKTIISLLIYSGMRRGELLGLEWKDIDFNNNVIHILRTSQYVSKMGIITKDTKTVSSERTIALPPTAFKILEEYRAYWTEAKDSVREKWNNKITITLADGKKLLIDNDRLFVRDNGLPMNPDSINNWIEKFIEKYDLPKFTPHSLRHTNASLLIANGVNIPTVSKRLGHSNISTTTKIYSHAIQSSDEKALAVLSDKLDPLNNQ